MPLENILEVEFCRMISVSFLRDGLGVHMHPKSWHCQNWVDPNPLILASWWIWPTKAHKCDSQYFLTKVNHFSGKGQTPPSWQGIWGTFCHALPTINCTNLQQTKRICSGWEVEWKVGRPEMLLVYPRLTFQMPLSSYSSEGSLND